MQSSAFTDIIYVEHSASWKKRESVEGEMKKWCCRIEVMVSILVMALFQRALSVGLVAWRLLSTGILILPALTYVTAADAGSVFDSLHSTAKIMPDISRPDTKLRVRSDLVDRVTHLVALEAPSKAILEKEFLDVIKPGLPKKTGVRRELEETENFTKTASRLKWTRTDSGGQVAAIQISSSGARSLRLGILVDHLPPAALLRFHAPSDVLAYEVVAGEVVAVLEKNRLAGDVSDRGKTFWSPIIDGDTITFELELPPGIPASEVSFGIPTLSHLVKSPWERSHSLEMTKIGQSAACEVDVSCSPDWLATANSVALMNFVDGGTSYECTGTLLADTVSDSFVPYFITASHCIKDQTTASTLATMWFYRSTSCNSGIASPSLTVNSDGATLLYASSATDTAFMQLNSPPPGGASFSAWSSTAPVLGSGVGMVHQPQGDLQKLSIGTLDEFDSCTKPDATGIFTCTTANSSTGNYFNVAFSSGSAEEGSSGSGLFSFSGGQRYLIGTFLGGSGSCTKPQGSNRYGRFDIAYSVALHQWLSGSSIPSLGQAVDNSGYDWITGGNGTFFSQGGAFMHGSSSLQSGNIADGESVFLQTEVSGPGTLSFYWKVSSEANYDFLGVYVDGVRQGRISGDVNWTRTALNIPEGTHVVRWVYSKDISDADGLDAGWLDNVQFATGPIIPMSGLWAVDGEVNGQPGRGFNIEVRNGILAVTVFAYDQAGNDVFYQAAGSYSGNTFSGPLNYYANGTSFGGPPRSAVLTGSAGSITMTFTDSTHGAIVLPGEAAKPFSKFLW